MATTLTPVETKVPGLELATSDSTVEFNVTSTDRFVVHFTNPKALGKEFITLEKGLKDFPRLTPRSQKNSCYVWTEAELALGLVNWEAQATDPMPDKPGPVRPMVPPIIIPPGW
jgi:hypothetical protein